MVALVQIDLRVVLEQQFELLERLKADSDVDETVAGLSKRVDIEVAEFLQVSSRG